MSPKAKAERRRSSVVMPVASAEAGPVGSSHDPEGLGQRMVLQDQLFRSSQEINTLRRELDAYKARSSTEAHQMAAKELHARQVVCVEGAVVLQGKLDALTAEHRECGARLGEARKDAAAARAMAAALQKVVEDRTQEVVIARGEAESMHALAEKLQEAAASMALPPSSASLSLVRNCEFCVLVGRAYVRARP